MTDTTSEVTSDVRTCANCESPFGGQDDKRYRECLKCRGGETATEEPPTMEQAGVKPIHIDVEKVPTPKPVARDFYWCGATKDSPIHNVTLGGISFPKNNGEVREGAPGEGQKFIDNTVTGQVHQLTKAHVGLILEHAGNKVIRRYRTETLGNDPSGEQTTVHMGDIISKSGSRSRPFVPQEGDIPVGCFVYMIKVRNRADRPYTDPPTMVTRDF